MYASSRRITKMLVIKSLLYRCVPQFFWSQPVQFVQWAHMHYFASVCPSVCLWQKFRPEFNSYLEKYEAPKTYFGRQTPVIGRGLLLWQSGLIANVKLHFSPLVLFQVIKMVLCMGMSVCLLALSLVNHWTFGLEFYYGDTWIRPTFLRMRATVDDYQRVFMSMMSLSCCFADPMPGFDSCSEAEAGAVAKSGYITLKSNAVIMPAVEPSFTSTKFNEYWGNYLPDSLHLAIWGVRVAVIETVIWQMGIEMIAESY